jgi:hypothetical protein
MEPRPHAAQPGRSEAKSKASPIPLRLRRSRGYAQSERENQQGLIREKVAIGILGFSAVHYPTSMQEIEFHDAATDLLVADTFEMLDGTYPGSKFIYTVRERTKWLESCRRHWRKRGPINDIRRELRSRLYGTIDFDPDLFSQAYDRHESRVLNYFAKRSDDLLVLAICRERTDWGELCSFIGVPVPNISFPNTNRVDSLDEILLRLLHVIGTVEQVAMIAKVSTQYVEELQGSEAFRNHDSEAPLSCDGNRKVDKILKRACWHFGSINAAAKLKLPKASLEDAMARHRRRKRAKLFKEWKLKLHQLVTRTSVG